MTDAERRRELSARWQNLRQKMSDVIGPRPSDDELVIKLKEACELRTNADELSQEIWDFLSERGCLTARTLRWIEDHVPDFARPAGRLLQELESQPAQTAMELAES